MTKSELKRLQEVRRTALPKQEDRIVVAFRETLRDCQIEVAGWSQAKRDDAEATL